MNAANTAQEAKEALNKIVYKSSEANFKGISDSLDKDSSSGGKSAEVFDFMKRQVELLNKEIEKLKSNMDSVVGYNAKNKFADSIISDYNKQIELYKNMMVIYQQEADKIGLSDDYVQKIKNGYGVIETIGNETLSNQVSEYQKWQDEIDSCAESIDDLYKQIKEMNYTKLDNMTDQFDQLNNSMNDVIDTSEELLELIEKSGEGVVGIDDYERLVKLQSDYALENAKYAKQLKDEMLELGITQEDVKWNEYSDQIKKYEKNMISAEGNFHGFLLVTVKVLNSYENFLSTLYMCYKELDKRFAVLHGKKITKKARIESTVLNSLTPISKAEICKILPDVSPTTVEAVLGAMVKNGSVSRIGKGRSTRYIRARDGKVFAVVRRRFQNWT